jgi:hypothetical protein
MKKVRRVRAFMETSLASACRNVPPREVEESCESPLTRGDEIAARKVMSIGEVDGTTEILCVVFTTRAATRLQMGRCTFV